LKEIIISLVPMATIYAIASLFALSRRGGGGLRRWGRMHLWLLGAIVAAFVLAYIEWSIPVSTPSLMALAGSWLLPCIIVAWIIAALLSYLRTRAARRVASPNE
jgi:hypothetical protein